MSPKYPVTTGPKLLKALQRGGFVIDRQHGSHAMMSHPDRPNEIVTVPIHARVDLKIKVLKSILRQANLSVEELKILL